MQTQPSAQRSSQTHAPPRTQPGWQAHTQPCSRQAQTPSGMHRHAAAHLLVHGRRPPYTWLAVQRTGSADRALTSSCRRSSVVLVASKMATWPVSARTLAELRSWGPVQLAGFKMSPWPALGGTCSRAAACHGGCWASRPQDGHLASPQMAGAAAGLAQARPHSCNLLWCQGARVWDWAHMPAGTGGSKRLHAAQACRPAGRADSAHALVLGCGWPLDSHPLHPRPRAQGAPERR